jgi:hypothetical protein
VPRGSFRLFRQRSSGPMTYQQEENDGIE